MQRAGHSSKVARWIGGLLLGVCLAACQSAQAPARKTVVSETISEEALLDRLDTLGAIAYDHPEQYINRPDSFLNRLPRRPTSPEGKEMYAWLLLNVAYALREHGHTLESIQYYETALNYCTSEQLTSPDRVLYIARPLGNLYTQVGDLQKALHIHLKAIQLTKGQASQQAALYGNLAIVYQQLGQPDKVLEACKSGLSYLDPTALQAALLYNTMASTYQERQHLDSAHIANGSALTLLTNHALKGDTVLWYAEALHQKGLLTAQQHRIDQALPFINRAIELAETHFPFRKNREKAKYYYMRGNLKSLNNQPTDAKADFIRVLDLLGATETDFPADYTITDALWGLARIHRSQQPDSAVYYYTKTLEHSYYTQQLITSKRSHYQNSAWNRSLLQEVISALLETYRTTTDQVRQQDLILRMLWVIELSKGRQLLQEVNRTNRWAATDRPDLQENREHLQYLYGQLAATRDTTLRSEYRRQIANTAFQLQLSEQHFDRDFTPPVMRDFNDFAGRVSESKALISYFMPDSGSGLAIYCVQGQYRIHSIDSVRKVSQRINHFVQDYFHAGPSAYENNPGAYERRADGLRETLMPFFSALQQKELIVSLDGILFTLPFEALMEKGCFLVQSNSIAYTYTLLLNQRYATIETVHPGIRCFAKSDYGGKLPDLPFVAAEKELLSSQFNGEIFEGANLTDSAILDALEHGALLHISAHAVSGDGVSPYIAFDRPFTLDKLSYAVTQSPLVVLSACYTATGTPVKAEGLESLNKAFISKGVLGVIAAYWPVDDATMPKFMRLFYEQLAKQHVPSVALSRAKQLYLENATIPLKNPWYWATLNYTGVYTRIIVSESTPWKGWVLGIAGFGFLGIGIGYFRHRRKAVNIKSGQIN
ncbi:CHAT domain-containing protein [Parapedobacter sp. 10938]|uniref:CHAT domain-containing protein n=1 Tax=Parapedobacter flavus TaxID=3110225 RepID=UPI002DC011CD|nr:CHAT domain-containing tetratricopeptide repeat protein [Parapedobacter sp. 10938]MEC3879623.1 CHAT domain-containing tetratricopeptide repeat protein [Parapedobacter sp. 10938]